MNNQIPPLIGDIIEEWINQPPGPIAKPNLIQPSQQYTHHHTFSSPQILQNKDPAGTYH